MDGQEAAPEEQAPATATAQLMDESSGLPEPDPLLAELYGSDRPPVELLPHIPLSPIVTACLVPKDPKDMLTESWIPVPPEGTEEGGPAPPAFDPAAAEYTDLVKRLAKSASFLKWNELNGKVKQLEAEVAHGGADAEVKQAELEAIRGTLAEVDGQLSELKASFQETSDIVRVGKLLRLGYIKRSSSGPPQGGKEPTAQHGQGAEVVSLVPWMQTLFDLADAGMTTFSVSGAFWPYCNLNKVFAAKADASPFEGVERVLGTFKRRYERERSAKKIQVLVKLAPNIFADGFGPAALESAVERSRVNIYGAESTEPLDLLELVWWDLQTYDVLPILKTLQALATDKLDISEEGEVTIAEPKKIRGIGLVDFPPAAIKSAIQAGVPITSVQVAYNLLERGAAPTLALCAEYGIKVLARDGTLGGLASEKYIGVPQPDAGLPDADLDSVPGCLDLANNIGGWPKLQKVLAKLKGIADKHEVKVETVAIRWLIDQGTFPVLAPRWSKAAWRQFGHLHWREPGPGVDAQLFQKASFLDEADARTLASIHL